MFNNNPFPPSSNWGSFTRLAGIPSSIYHRASPSLQSQLWMIGIGMLFTACFSGVLLALSIYYYTEEWSYSLAAFLIAATLTLILDRKLVTATVPLGVGGRLVRLSLVVAWIILHTTMIETVFFTEDLQIHLEQQQAPQVAQIKEEYHLAKNLAEKKRAEVRATIAESEETVRKAYEKEVREADGDGVTGQAGFGNMTAYLQDVTKRREAQEKLIVERQQKELALINEHFTLARDIHDRQLAQLPVIDHYGPLKRSELLHEMLWSDGHLSMKFIAFAIMLIITAVELLPLIGKGLADFEEYYTLHRNDMMRTLAYDKMNARIQDEINAVEMAHRAHLEKTQLREEYRRRELSIHLNEVLARFQQKVNSIQALDDEIGRANRHKMAIGLEHIKAASNQALKELSALVPEQESSDYQPKSSVS